METGAEAPVRLTSHNALCAGTTPGSSRRGSAASGVTDRSFRNPHAGSAKKRSGDEVLETTETHDAQAISSATRVAKNSPPAARRAHARVNNNSEKRIVTNH
jgi:hypothetical protein